MADIQTRALARRLASLEKARLQSKQANLGFSTIDGGAVQAQDDEGNLTMIVGVQFDQTNAPVVVTGPPPPVPTLPYLTAIQGGLRIYWDGTFVDAVAPMDWARVVAYAVPLASYAGPDPLNQTIMVGTFDSATGSEITSALDPGVEYAVYFVSWTIAGKYGNSSDVATGTPAEVVLPEELAAKSTVYRQTTAPWPDGDTTHDEDDGDLWFNTSLGPGSLFNIVACSVTSNVATVATNVEHDIIVGNTINVDSVVVDPTFNGTFVVTAVTSTTVSWALTHADLPAVTSSEGIIQGQDVTALNRPAIWDAATDVWIITQDSDTTAASTLDRVVKTNQSSIETLRVTAIDAQNTAYAADGRVSISDYEPGPDDVAGKQDGSLWITRTRDRRNLAVNPSWEGAAVGWSSGGLSAASIVTATGPAGAGAKVIQLTNDTSGGAHFVYTAAYVPVEEGQQHIVSGYLKSVSGSGTGYYASINYFDASFSLVGFDFGAVGDINTTEWTRFYAVGTAPATAVWCLPGFAAPPAAISAVWQLDAVLIEQGSRLGRYFDGNSEGGSWTGTVNESVSELDGNAIIKLFTLEDEAWTEKFWTADTIQSVSASAIDRGEVSGAFLTDHTIPVDKLYMPGLLCAEDVVAGNLVHVANVGGLAMVYLADGNNGRRATGFVLDTVATGGVVQVYTTGYNPLMSGLTPGTQFLSATAGGASNAPQTLTSTISQRVGYAVDATTLVFQAGTAVNLT